MAKRRRKGFRLHFKKKFPFVSLGGSSWRPFKVSASDVRAARSRGFRFLRVGWYCADAAGPDTSRNYYTKSAAERACKLR